MLVNLDDVDIFVREAGTGEPLLLIHGLGMSSELWVHQLPAFAAHYRTIAVDLRGFGQSSRPHAPGAYNIDVLAADMAALVQRLDLAPCHVLGTSMGGFVAQALALAHPDLCRSLLLCHTAPRMEIPADVVAQRVAALATMSMGEYGVMVAEQALGPAAGADIRTWLIDLIAANDQRSYSQVLTEGLSGFDVTAALHQISLPTLIVAGQYDRVLPPAGSHELARLVPHAQLVELPDVGHLGYAESPGRFNAAVLSFLHGLSGSQTPNATSGAPNS